MNRTLDRKSILHMLAAHQEELKKLGVTYLALFGSVARNEATAGSDVDFLVEFEGPASFDTYMELKFFLEDLLGTRIDLVTRKALKPRLRPYVEKEAIRVA